MGCLRVRSVPDRREAVEYSRAAERVLLRATSGGLRMEVDGSGMGRSCVQAFGLQITSTRTSRAKQHIHYHKYKPQILLPHLGQLESHFKTSFKTIEQQPSVRSVIQYTRLAQRRISPQPHLAALH